MRDRRVQADLGQIRDWAATGADGACRLMVLEGVIGRGEVGEQATGDGEGDRISDGGGKDEDLRLGAPGYSALIWPLRIE